MQLFKFKSVTNLKFLFVGFFKVSFFGSQNVILGVIKNVALLNK